MGQTILRLMALAAILPAAFAMAAEVPAPIKKPRDKSGAASVRPVEKHHTLPGHILKTGTIKDQARSKTDPASVGLKSGSAAEGAIGQKPATISPPVLQAWSGAEIEAAKQHCAVVLKGLNVVAVPEPPKREGSCGAPAPFRLVSLGTAPQVSLDPPPLLTCDMILSLSKWVKNDLQPLAKKHLASEIIKIETMSDYSCRAAYGRVGGKWSEHAYANALDIRGFVTAKAETAYLLEGWGPTGRDIIAATKAATAKDKATAAVKPVAPAVAIKQAPAAKPSEPAAAPTTVPTAAVAGTQPPVDTATSSTSASLPSLFRSTISPLPASAVDPANTGLGFKPPTQLGGPKDNKNDAPTLGPKGQTAAFLRAAHASACKIFGTTLGPEANNAHRNHFHVDMAPRKVTKICE